MPRSARQILLVRYLQLEEDEDPAAAALNAVPLGTSAQVADALSAFNTAMDGSNKPEDFGVLHGPGFIAQLPMVGPKDPVMQVGVSIHEEEMAFPVLIRMCRRLGWKMLDPQSGRAFG